MKRNRKSIVALVLLLNSMTGFVACGAPAADADAESTTAQTGAAQTGTETGSSESITEPVVTPKPYVDKLDRSDEGFVLVWNDEFDGETLDLTKWDFQYGNGGEYGNPGWGNQEVQYYLNREENVRVEDGKLIITAVKEDSAMPYTSARLRTVTNRGDVLFATTYGRIEARIKMPAEEGLWPAFWLLPVDTSVYGGWAASGEIDIMEAKGRLPEQIGGALHYGRVWPNNTYQNKDYFFEDGTEITDFHLYSIEWEPGEIRWYVDNECYFTVNDWYSEDETGTRREGDAPFDVPFYILLNMAIGGKFDPEADLNNAEFPAQMEVDFVRVYHKEEGYGIEEPVTEE